VVYLGQQAVHHGLVYLQLVLDAEVDEVGVDKYVVRRTQLLIVLKEHGRGHLVHLFGAVLLDLVCVLVVLLFLLVLVRLYPRVLGRDDLLSHTHLASHLLLPHPSLCVSK
jgi:hypothetical protein